MSLRANAVVSVVASLIRLYPKTSIATAFEIGMLAAVMLRSARARRLTVGAKLIDAEVLPARRKRKGAPRKRKAVQRRAAAVPAKAA